MVVLDGAELFRQCWVVDPVLSVVTPAATVASVLCVVTPAATVASVLSVVTPAALLGGFCLAHPFLSSLSKADCQCGQIPIFISDRRL